VPNYKDGVGNYKASGKFTIVKKTSDEAVDTTTTVQDDDELFIPLKASTRYGFSVEIYFTTPAAADYKYTFKLITGTSYAGFDGRGASSTEVINFGSNNWLDDTDGGLETLLIFGRIKTGTGGGTLQFQFAQLTSNAGDTITHEGSNIILYEI